MLTGLSACAAVVVDASEVCPVKTFFHAAHHMLGEPVDYTSDDLEIIAAALQSHPEAEMDVVSLRWINARTAYPIGTSRDLERAFTGSEPLNAPALVQFFVDNIPPYYFPIVDLGDLAAKLTHLRRAPMEFPQKSLRGGPSSPLMSEEEIS
jgi:hypothetical protein